MQNVFQCENSTDGIFTGIYDAWDSRLGHKNIKLQILAQEDMELFTNYIQVETDAIKAEKVARTLRNRLSAEDYYHIYQATLSKDKNKADSIYRTVVLGLSGNYGKDIMQNLQNPYICHVFEMSRNIGNESHSYLGFIRFRELENGVLFSEIHPENQVLPLIGDHFADRFPREHFMIYDSTHKLFLVHEASKIWGLVEGEQLNRQLAEAVSGGEQQFQSLWQTFCTTIGIKERQNKRLQQQMLPLKFRSFMTEIYE